MCRWDAEKEREGQSLIYYVYVCSWKGAGVLYLVTGGPMFSVLASHLEEE